MSGGMSLRAGFVWACQELGMLHLVSFMARVRQQSLAQGQLNPQIQHFGRQISHFDISEAATINST